MLSHGNTQEKIAFKKLNISVGEPFFTLVKQEASRLGTMLTK